MLFFFYSSGVYTMKDWMGYCNIIQIENVTVQYYPFGLDIVYVCENFGTRQICMFCF